MGEKKTKPDFKFYGRIKGVRLSDRQSRLITSLLPQVRLDLNQPLPVSHQETWLEIGFGGGEHLAHQAINNPHISFIGAEPFVNGVAKLLVAIEENNIGNLAIHDDDVRTLLPKIPDACLSRVFVLYPDPWHKQRHRKRRMVNDDTVAHFHRILKPAGVFRFASDIEDYVQWTVAAVRKHGGFEFSGDSIRDWRQPPADWHRTRYEAKALREGRTPSYISFIRR
ncbi:tRNA (guanine(46)-N(7))-methyltransferase [hydrothermal vent metagenome]|uniref:tRNA (guanine(46)-N(7))-methyltransferase n=1 Tax=hydrothermal vent metagenome TaxID=652676 RepID=A0A3B0S2S2_9ZZZZ